MIGRTADGTAFESAESEFRDAWHRIGVILAECGCSTADIIELVTFQTEISQAETEAFLAVKLEALKSHSPAWTAVGTTWLAIPGARVEIKVTALVPS